MPLGSVIINDVGPRDGLQSQAKLLSPDQRIALVGALLDAGLRHVEAGAFVSPRAVPAMAGTGEVLAGVRSHPGAGDSVLTVLVPNARGYELAVAAGAKSVCLVLYGTDGMAQANVGMSRQQAESVAAGIIGQARNDGVRVTSTIAVAFECPFEGPVAPSLVIDLAGRFLELGTDELCIADTIGAANPRQVRILTSSLVENYDPGRLACHFHDTRAMGLANVFAALESGIRKFDASIGGMGGCPFAPGASGNVATEDVVMMLEQMGYDTGIELAALMRASRLARDLTGTAPGGRSGAWLAHHLETGADT
jgi:hydroxymethylglutaryl-CoA lyase